MNLTLYRYTGERNRVDKSDYLQFLLSTSGQFKADVSLESPVLRLSLPSQYVEELTDENGNEIAEVGIMQGNEDSVLDFNYIYVQEFNRYYYVTDIVISSNRILTVYLDVDPLYSFKEEILNQNAIVSRSQTRYDPLLPDNEYPLDPIKEVIEYSVENLGRENFSFSTDFDISSDTNITIVTAGQSGLGFEHSGIGELPSIDTNSFSDAGGTTTFATTVNGLRSVISAMMSQFSAYSSFFVSATAFPFIVEKNNTDVGIYITKQTGYDSDNIPTFASVTLANPGYFAPASSKYLILADFQIPEAESFLDLEPFARYEIWIPFYGWHELSIKEIQGDELLVYYSVSYQDGSAEVYLYDYTQSRVLFTSTCQIGIPLSLSSTNAQELAAQKRALQLNLILGLVSSGVSLGVGAVSGNPIGAIGGIISGANALTQYTNATSTMFERAQATHNGAIGALYSPLEVRLRITRSKGKISFDTFAIENGRPYQKGALLRNMAGYTRVDIIHLENINALDIEKAEILQALRTGVIL